MIWMFSNHFLAMKNKFDVIGISCTNNLLLDDYSLMLGTQMVGVWGMEARVISLSL